MKSLIRKKYKMSHDELHITTIGFYFEQQSLVNKRHIRIFPNIFLWTQLLILRSEKKILFIFRKKTTFVKY